MKDGYSYPPYHQPLHTPYAHNNTNEINSIWYTHDVLIRTVKKTFHRVISLNGMKLSLFWVIQSYLSSYSCKKCHIYHMLLWIFLQIPIISRIISIYSSWYFYSTNALITFIFLATSYWKPWECMSHVSSLEPALVMCLYRCITSCIPGPGQL